jgi:hypothetical protein
VLQVYDEMTKNGYKSAKTQKRNKQTKKKSTPSEEMEAALL